ncbi:autophagy protein 5 [Linnemannia zychae]|nr:autophagy protein 5 [Linnemannia zychae]
MNSAPEDVLRVIWNGSIPIQFTWDPMETRKHDLEPYFVEAPRCSYLTLLTTQIHRHFTTKRLGFAVDESEMWFDYEGLPLKWHYPIGLLFDIYILQATSSKKNTAFSLPWQVTIHSRNFPNEKLIKNPTLKNCQDYFMSMVKEADYLRNGSTKKVMNMSKSDQTQLWEGLQSKSYEQFWEMNKKLVSSDGITARNLPVRVYLPESCPIVQDLVSSLDEQGQPRTLRQILHAVVPDLFPLEDPGLNVVASVLIHGIRPSLDIDACWAVQTLAYPDNFLHLVVMNLFMLLSAFLIHDQRALLTHNLYDVLMLYFYQNVDNWNAVSRQLGNVPVPFLIRHSAFLYQNQLQDLHRLGEQQDLQTLSRPTSRTTTGLGVTTGETSSLQQAISSGSHQITDLPATIEATRVDEKEPGFSGRKDGSFSGSTSNTSGSNVHQAQDANFKAQASPSLSTSISTFPSNARPASMSSSASTIRPVQPSSPSPSIRNASNSQQTMPESNISSTVSSVSTPYSQSNSASQIFEETSFFNQLSSNDSLSHGQQHQCVDALERENEYRSNSLFSQNQGRYGLSFIGSNTLSSSTNHRQSERNDHHVDDDTDGDHTDKDDDGSSQDESEPLREQIKQLQLEDVLAFLPIGGASASGMLQKPTDDGYQRRTASGDKMPFQLDDELANLGTKSLEEILGRDGGEDDDGERATCQPKPEPVQSDQDLKPKSQVHIILLVPRSVTYQVGTRKDTRSLFMHASTRN